MTTTYGGRSPMLDTSPDCCRPVRPIFDAFIRFRFPPERESRTATNPRQCLATAAATSSRTAPADRSSPTFEYTSVPASESAAIDLRVTRVTDAEYARRRLPSPPSASWLHSPPAVGGAPDDQPLNLTTANCRNSKTYDGCRDGSAVGDYRSGRWEDDACRCCCSWCGRGEGESAKDRKHAIVATATPPYTPTSAGSQRSSSSAADADCPLNVSETQAPAEILQRQGWHCSRPKALRKFLGSISFTLSSSNAFR